MMVDPKIHAKDEKQESSSIKETKKGLTRKALDVSTGFESSYVLFFMYVKDRIQAEQGGNISAPVVSKKASELWKALSTEDRQHWDNEARKEKKRNYEKATYIGSMLMPRKRAKKDPSAPKRNPSAFLLFAKGKRQELKKLSPNSKNTDISCILGQLWRDMPLGEKQLFIDREIRERKWYKEAMAKWKEQQEENNKSNKGISDAIPRCIGIVENQQASLCDDLTDWKRMENDMQTNGNRGSMSSSCSSVTKVESVKFERHAAVHAHGQYDNTHNFKSYSSYNPRVERERSNISMFENEVTTQADGGGSNLSIYYSRSPKVLVSSQGDYYEDNYRQHRHYFQLTSKNHINYDFFQSEPLQYQQKNLSMIQTQFGDEVINDAYRNSVPSFDEFEPLPFDSNVFDQRNNFSLPISKPDCQKCYQNNEVCEGEGYRYYEEYY